MTNYVLGFRFRESRGRGIEVALIKKNKPHWQAGKLNGIGGKVEGTDLTRYTAMEREFEEETGAHIPSFQWRLFAELQHDGNVVHCFTSFGECKLRQTTAEHVDWYGTQELAGIITGRPIMQNLLWLIPLALDADNVVAVIKDPSIIPKAPNVQMA